MSKDAIMTMVERELKAHPDITSSDLHKKVAKKHAAAGKLTVRQFHARYPLRVKKRWSLERGTAKTAKRRKAATPRTRATRKQASTHGVRDLLVQFADELLQMKDPSFTQVLSRVDHYAERLGEH